MLHYNQSIESLFPVLLITDNSRTTTKEEPQDLTVNYNIQSLKLKLLCQPGLAIFPLYIHFFFETILIQLTCNILF